MAKEKEEIEMITEKPGDAKKFIKILGDTKWSTDNDAQMKAVSILKGLALSDEPTSNEFMKKMDAASSRIAKEVLGESIVSENIIEDIANAYLA